MPDVEKKVRELTWHDVGRGGIILAIFLVGYWFHTHFILFPQIDKMIEYDKEKSQLSLIDGKSE